MYGRGNSGLGFGPPVTPPVVKQLLIANGIVFVLQLLMAGNEGSLSILFGATPEAFWEEGWLWQPFTYMWLHSERFWLHIAMNMFMLWMFGSPLALVWGPRRFLRFYLICGVGAGFIIVTLPYLLSFLPRYQAAISYPTVGASGAVYALLLGYSLTWPDRVIMLIFPPVAFRAIWLIPLTLGLTLLMGGSNISHEGHLGGVLFAWVLMHRESGTRLLPSFDQLKYRWRRYRMRRKLRAVRTEETRRSWDDDHTIH